MKQILSNASALLLFFLLVFFVVDKCSAKTQFPPEFGEFWRRWSCRSCFSSQIHEIQIGKIFKLIPSALRWLMSLGALEGFTFFLKRFFAGAIVKVTRHNASIPRKKKEKRKIIFAHYFLPPFWILFEMEKMRSRNIK